MTQGRIGNGQQAIYIYIYTGLYIYMCIYISEGLRPLPPAPFLWLIACWLGGLLDCCVCCQAGRQATKLIKSVGFMKLYEKIKMSWQFLHHLYASGGSRACLLTSILAAVGGLGPHVGGSWRCQGLGLGPGLARGRQNGLDCTLARAGALFC